MFYGFQAGFCRIRATPFHGAALWTSPALMRKLFLPVGRHYSGRSTLSLRPTKHNTLHANPERRQQYWHFSQKSRAHELETGTGHKRGDVSSVYRGTTEWVYKSSGFIYLTRLCVHSMWSGRCYADILCPV